MLFDHVDLRVTSLRQARGLYDALLPAMGWSRMVEDAGSVCYYDPSGERSLPFFGLVEDPAHRPNDSRLALRANSRADVERLAGVAQAAGAGAFEPAHICEEYTPFYFATFFEDIDGNKLEICYREKPAGDAP